MVHADCQTRDNISISREMHLPKTGATHYHEPLKLLDKGCAIKRVDGLQWLGFKAFWPAKLSGPRFLPTIPWDMIILYIFIVFQVNTEMLKCLPSCSGHGQVDVTTGLCDCYDGWEGLQCQTSKLSLAAYCKYINFSIFKSTFCHWTKVVITKSLFWHIRCT